MTERRQIRLRKFNPATMPRDSIALFVGMRNTGKSVMIQDVLWHHREQFHRATVLTATDWHDHMYNKYIPDESIHDGWSPETVNQAVDHSRDHPEQRELLILDDCLYDKSWIRNNGVCDIFKRAPRMMCLITMQYAMGLQFWMRTNIDYVFIFRENFMANRRRIYEQYMNNLCGFDIFCQLMNQCTDNYECLVVDNTNIANKALEERVFWYCATIDPPPFSCISSE